MLFKCSILSRHNLHVVDVILVSPRCFLNVKVGTTSFKTPFLHLFGNVSRSHFLHLFGTSSILGPALVSRFIAATTFVFLYMVSRIFNPLPPLLLGVNKLAFACTIHFAFNLFRMFLINWSISLFHIS